MAASDGYALSQWARKRIEEVFAWVESIAAWRKTGHRGLARGGWLFWRWLPTQPSKLLAALTAG